MVLGTSSTDGRGLCETRRLKLAEQGLGGSKDLTIPDEFTRFQLGVDDSRKLGSAWPNSEHEARVQHKSCSGFVTPWYCAGDHCPSKYGFVKDEAACGRKTLVKPNQNKLEPVRSSFGRRSLL